MCSACFVQFVCCGLRVLCCFFGGRFVAPEVCDGYYAEGEVVKREECLAAVQDGYERKHGDGWICW